MTNSAYPEKTFTITIHCFNNDVCSTCAGMIKGYKDLVMTDNILKLSYNDFVSVLCIYPLYRSAISQVCEIDYEKVNMSEFSADINLEITYVDCYWAQRFSQEVFRVIALYGKGSGLESPSVNGHTASVVCKTWDALSDIDKIIMKAGYGYSISPVNAQVTESRQSGQVFVYICIITIVFILLILLALSMSQ